MKKMVFFLFLMSGFAACNQKKETVPETALDTGREFIRASLNGNFDRASSLLLTDSQNVQLFESYKVFYEKLSSEKKKGYKEASYEINKYLDVDDSTTLINYSNSYMNKPMDIKLVRNQKKWAVDFKYTYSGNLPIE
ncbi:MAG: DUF4878 domain-containing protein [Gloeobacteraceae cyanobacterium ES-bin-316]|nr:DUF4878 domain-containing protein [Ferruginibacter sp.]